MKRTFLVFAIGVALTVPFTVWPSDVKRLDGSVIAPDEIDGAVAWLMRAAEEPGVGIAIFNDGKCFAHRRQGHSDQTH